MTLEDTEREDSISLPLRTTGNRAFVFVSFSFSKDEGAKKATQSFANLSTAVLFKGLGIDGGESDRRVWEQLSAKDANNAIHMDLYPVVRQILVGGKQNDGNNRQRHTRAKRHFHGTAFSAATGDTESELCASAHRPCQRAAPEVRA